MVLGLFQISAAVIIDFDKNLHAGGNMNQAPTIQANVELGGGAGLDNQTRISLTQNLTNPWSSTAGDYTGPAFMAVWDSIELNGPASWDSRDSNPISIRAQASSDTQDFLFAIDFEKALTFSFDASSSLSVNFSLLEMGVEMGVGPN